MTAEERARALLGELSECIEGWCNQTIPGCECKQDIIRAIRAAEIAAHNAAVDAAAALIDDMELEDMAIDDPAEIVRALKLPEDRA